MADDPIMDFFIKVFCREMNPNNPKALKVTFVPNDATNHVFHIEGNFDRMKARQFLTKITTSKDITDEIYNLSLVSKSDFHKSQEGIQRFQQIVRLYGEHLIDYRYVALRIGCRMPFQFFPSLGELNQACFQAHELCLIMERSLSANDISKQKPAGKNP